MSDPAVASVGEGGAERVFRAGPAPELPIFDVHVNALPPGGNRAVEAGGGAGFYSTIGVDEVASLGLARACVGPPSLPSYGEANAGIRVWAAGRVDALPIARLRGRGPAPVRSLWQARLRASAVRRRPEPTPDLEGFAGVKLMPHVDGVPPPRVMDEIADRRLPALVHAGSWVPAGWIERALLPRLAGPVILAHLGGWPCDAGGVEAAVGLARRDERVYLETSGASIGNFVRVAAESAPDKVLFGSNTPMCSARVQWRHVASAVQRDAVLERIAFRNAERVFASALGESEGRGGNGDGVFAAGGAWA